MTLNDKEKLFSILQTKMQDIAIRSIQLKDDDIPLLRVMVPLGSEASDIKVSMELRVIDYNDHADIVQIYTPLLESSEDGLVSLCIGIEDWNLVATAGAYGIFQPNRQLYHKYNVGIHVDTPLDEKVNTVFLGICLALDEISSRLEEALELCGGVLYKVD